MHGEAHAKAGKTVKLIDGKEFRLEDWWDRIGGESWQLMRGKNFAARNYGIRASEAGLPIDDEVVYGKIGALGHIVHVSELVE